MTKTQTEAQAAITHFQGKLTKILFAAQGRDEEEVMQEIGQDFSILIADMNDAKANEHGVKSVREVKNIADNIHDTILEAFQDTNSYIENSGSSEDPNAEHKFGHFEYGLGRTH